MKSHWSALALSACLVSAVQADEKATQQLLQVLKPIHGMQAQFAEDTFNATGAVQQHNDGEVIAQEPNRFYWKTAEPYPQEIITNGQQLWIYDPDLQQVTIKPFEQNLAKTPAMLFAGNAASIADNFNIEQSTPITAGNQAWKLTPKNDQRDLFQSLDMEFHNGMPVSMKILDAMSQATVIHFDRVQLNPDNVGNRFEFVPPPGVEVLRAKAAAAK